MHTNKVIPAGGWLSTAQYAPHKQLVQHTNLTCLHKAFFNNLVEKQPTVNMKYSWLAS